MGEIAEMMLDGTLCTMCGTYLGAEFGPQHCRDCARQEAKERKPRIACPHCMSFVKVAGLNDHIRAVHPEKQS